MKKFVKALGIIKIILIIISNALFLTAFIWVALDGLFPSSKNVQIRATITLVAFLIALLPAIFSGIKVGKSEGGMYESGTYYLTTINLSDKTATTTKETNYKGTPVWLSCILFTLFYTFMYIGLGIVVIIYNLLFKKRKKLGAKKSILEKILRVLIWIILIVLYLIFFASSIHLLFGF